MKRLPEIEALGAGLAVVGLGNPTFAKGFRESTKYVGPLFVDGEGLAYRAAALRRLRPWHLLDPRLIRNAMRAKKEGFRQSRVAGDPWQLGGTLVVAPGDRVIYAWRNRNADDDAPMEEVLAALRAGAACATPRCSESAPRPAWP